GEVERVFRDRAGVEDPDVREVFLGGRSAAGLVPYRLAELEAPAQTEAVDGEVFQGGAPVLVADAADHPVGDRGDGPVALSGSGTRRGVALAPAAVGHRSRDGGVLHGVLVADALDRQEQALEVADL